MEIIQFACLLVVTVGLASWVFSHAFGAVLDFVRRVQASQFRPAWVTEESQRLSFYDLSQAYAEARRRWGPNDARTESLYREIRSREEQQPPLPFDFDPKEAYKKLFADN